MDIDFLLPMLMTEQEKVIAVKLLESIIGLIPASLATVILVRKTFFQEGAELEAAAVVLMTA